MEEESGMRHVFEGEWVTTQHGEERILSTVGVDDCLGDAGGWHEIETRGPSGVGAVRPVYGAWMTRRPDAVAALRRMVEAAKRQEGGAKCPS
jgi:hypothetical protein